ncbi:MAG: dihydroneopterin aldolase [Sphingobacteriales bacterium]|nr:MAG: dihydroneopterin aldolase [Sphingobacteriales bacterium]
MITVLLQGAEFFAYHGYYPEEQILGGRFVVDLAVSFNGQGNADDQLKNTVNYERLYHICCIEMKNTRKLIETVAQAISDQIKTDYPYTEHIELTVKKLHPPMKGIIAYSGVTVSYNKSDEL